MNRNKNKNGHKKYKKPLYIASVLGASAGAINAYATNGNDVKGFLTTLSENYTGVNPVTGDFSWNSLKKGLVPAMTGLAVTAFAKYKVNGTSLNTNLPKAVKL